MESVKLHLYDLSQGMARIMSPGILGMLAAYFMTRLQASKSMAYGTLESPCLGLNISTVVVSVLLQLDMQIRMYRTKK